MANHVLIANSSVEGRGGGHKRRVTRSEQNPTLVKLSLNVRKKADPVLVRPASNPYSGRTIVSCFSCCCFAGVWGASLLVMGGQKKTPEGRQHIWIACQSDSARAAGRVAQKKAFHKQRQIAVGVVSISSPFSFCRELGLSLRVVSEMRVHEKGALAAGMLLTRSAR